MAQALAKLRVQPSASPGFQQVQATIYDTVTLQFRTVSAQVPDASARDKTLLQMAMDTAFGAIDYALAAPPTP